MNLNERDELIELFEKYQGLLTQSQKQAMHLYLIEDLSLAEVAEELATTRQAVHDAINKGKAKLIKIKQSLNEG